MFKFKNKNNHTLILLLINVAIFAVMSIMSPRLFLTSGNFKGMMVQFPEFGVLSLGVMFTMIAGGIDLSLVGVANLSGIIATSIILMLGGDATAIVVGIGVGLVVGVLAGLLNGFIIEYFKLPPMLVTLATLQLFTGIGLIITKGPAISGLPQAFANISNGEIFGIPIPMIVFIAVVLVVNYILKFTVFGQELLLYGSNETATKYSGISTMKVVLKTYVISGVLGAVSGILMASHYNSAKSDYGVSYTLLSLLIVVLGGTDPDGGKQNLSGVVTSIFLLQLISSAFNILRVNAFIKTFIWGLLLLVVVLMTLRTRRDKNEKNN